MMRPEKVSGTVARLLSKEYRPKVIVLLGIVGMALILISQLVDTGLGPDGPSREGPPAVVGSAELETREYIRQLEERLQNLISQIEGVGRNKVMVTLESGVEYVYAQEQRRGAESVEQRFILVETEFGRREALVLTRLPPRVQGVVIVCEGAHDPVVRQKLISVVTTALGIASTRVSVVQIS